MNLVPDSGQCVQLFYTEIGRGERLFFLHRFVRLNHSGLFLHNLRRFKYKRVFTDYDRFSQRDRGLLVFLQPRLLNKHTIGAGVCDPHLVILHLKNRMAP